MNISLPNPPIGECIPDVPDAPWIPYTPDVDILWEEEFNTQKPLIGDESQTRKKERLKRVIESDKQKWDIARKKFYLRKSSEKKSENFKLSNNGLQMRHEAFGALIAYSTFTNYSVPGSASAAPNYRVLTKRWTFGRGAVVRCRGHI